jgi:hypothetical protein
MNTHLVTSLLGPNRVSVFILMIFTSSPNKLTSWADVPLQKCSLFFFYFHGNSQFPFMKSYTGIRYQKWQTTSTLYSRWQMMRRVLFHWIVCFYAVDRWQHQRQRFSSPYSEHVSKAFDGSESNCLEALCSSQYSFYAWAQELVWTYCIWWNCESWLFSGTASVR